MPKQPIALWNICCLIALWHGHAFGQTYEQYQTQTINILEQSKNRPAKEVLIRLRQEIPPGVLIPVLDQVLRNRWEWNEDRPDPLAFEGSFQEGGVGMDVAPGFTADYLVRDELFYRYGWIHSVEREERGIEQQSRARRLAGLALADAHLKYEGEDSLIIMARDPNWRIAEPAFELLRQRIDKAGYNFIYSREERGWISLGIMLYARAEGREATEAVEVEAMRVVRALMSPDRHETEVLLTAALNSKYYGKSAKRIAGRLLAQIRVEIPLWEKNLLPMLSSPNPYIAEGAARQLYISLRRSGKISHLIELPMEIRERMIRAMLKVCGGTALRPNINEFSDVVLTLGKPAELVEALGSMIADPSIQEPQKRALARAYVISVEKAEGISGLVALGDSFTECIGQAAANRIRDRLKGRLGGVIGGDTTGLRNLPLPQKLKIVRLLLNDAGNISDEYLRLYLIVKLGSRGELVSILEQLLRAPAGSPQGLYQTKPAKELIEKLKSANWVPPKITCAYYLIKDWVEVSDQYDPFAH